MEEISIRLRPDFLWYLLANLPGVPVIYVYLRARARFRDLSTCRGRMPAYQTSPPVPRQHSASSDRWWCTPVPATSCFRVLPPPRPCDVPAATGYMFERGWVGSTMATELMVGAPAYLLVMAGVWAHVVGLWRHASDLSWHGPSMAVRTTGCGGASFGRGTSWRANACELRGSPTVVRWPVACSTALRSAI